MDTPDTFPSTPFDSVEIPEQFQDTRFVRAQILKHVRDDGALSRDAITAILLGFFKLEARLIVLEAGFEDLKTVNTSTPNDVAEGVLDSVKPLIDEQQEVIMDRLTNDFETQINALLDFGNHIFDIQSRLDQIEQTLIREGLNE